MSATFNQKHTSRDNCLDESGIGHDVERRLREGSEAIHSFLAMTGRRLHGQLHYDLLTNVPCGVMSREDAAPAETIRRAVAGAIGEFVQWDLAQARDMAFRILEDVNDHALAAEFLKLCADQQAKDVGS